MKGFGVLDFSVWEFRFFAVSSLGLGASLELRVQLWSLSFGVQSLWWCRL